ncbi:MAG TPA: endonuclease/exonuclease/phosphatase family protein [Gemmatales bacterium]|nr:endonuclease/exonuclease/phosphatase family protein [Gemmatales bacterium]
MLLATRFELSKVSSITAKELGANGFVAAYELNTSLGPVSIINVHLPTIRGQSGELEELIQGLPGSVDNFIKVLERRRDAVEKMKAWITTVPGPCILAGDFNMTSDDGLYRKSWKGYGNAFEKAGWGFGYTKWTSWHGVRIDHVLFEQTWQCIHAEVGPNLGSDHRPLYVELIPAGVN